jgi:two-component system sensor histidine kinase PilS (NtrC family)
VVLLNDTAKTMLDQPEAETGMTLDALSLPLTRLLRTWRDWGGLEVPAFRPVDHRPELIPRFTGLSGRQAATTLILLEDSAQAAERLQQIKLAALGRLTAGIAHEIRNPLAAISHAAQLLQESVSAKTTIGDWRKSFTIMSSAPTALSLMSSIWPAATGSSRNGWRWRRGWRLSARNSREVDGFPTEWTIEVQPADLAVSFDPHQLRQVLWNLCANACQHGVRPGETSQIDLCAGLDHGRLTPFLEVRDAGPGIAAENLVKLFRAVFYHPGQRHRSGPVSGP